jgi:Rrf2 family nitric oxide-sensitive transcriptional repressor
MQLYKATYHAVRILMECGHAGDGLVPCKELALRTRLTQQSVSKIGAFLCRTGFLTSVRGWHGGMRLARPAGQIGLGDVVRALEPAKTLATTTKALSPELKQVCDEAREALFGILNRYTIADLARHCDQVTASRQARPRSPRKRSAASGRRRCGDHRQSHACE